MAFYGAKYLMKLHNNFTSFHCCRYVPDMLTDDIK